MSVMSKLEIKGTTFWALVDGDKKASITLFSDKTEAIGVLTAQGNTAESNIMSITRVSEEEWKVEQISWKEIATELMKAIKK